jgi:hypothetical protein
LDLCSGAGGVKDGFEKAGYTVTTLDIDTIELSYNLAVACRWYGEIYLIPEFLNFYRVKFTMLLVWC